MSPRHSSTASSPVSRRSRIVGTRERATSHAARKHLLTGLYLVLDPSVRPDRPLVDVLRRAAALGVRLFQYRDKQASMKVAYTRALALRQAATEVRACLIINDRCDLALAVHADGVHLGQDDLPIADARRILGPNRLIGLSTHRPAQVREAGALKPDYIGFGPIFSTSTKADHDPVVGLEGLRAARVLTTVPIFAIGGITADRVGDILATGANGVAVISAILKAENLDEAITAFQEPCSSPSRSTD